MNSRFVLGGLLVLLASSSALAATESLVCDMSDKKAKPWYRFEFGLTPNAAEWKTGDLQAYVSTYESWGSLKAPIKEGLLYCDKGSYLKTTRTTGGKTYTTYDINCNYEDGSAGYGKIYTRLSKLQGSINFYDGTVINGKPIPKDAKFNMMCKVTTTR